MKGSAWGDLPPELVEAARRNWGDDAPHVRTPTSGSKYALLTDRLVGIPSHLSSVTYSFLDLEALCGPLPPSARMYRAWWGNDSRGQAVAWQSIGWVVKAVDLVGEVVTFGRAVGSPPNSPAIQTQDLSGVPEPSSREAPRAWFWEGNVVSAVTRHLAQEGWLVRSVADTATKQHGVDLIAERDGQRILVEAKGYPSKGYANPKRAHETKRTSPSTQAAHWFSSAIASAMRNRDREPKANIAIALPDFPRYRDLLKNTQGSLTTLGFIVFLVEEDGTVQMVLADALSDL